ncbi:MAG: CPBP family glutamic-type intramembrane protease [Candidatus Izemoplasmataceae bacterium]
MKPILRYLLFTFALTYLSHGMLALLTSQNIIEFSSLMGQLLFIIGGSSPTIFAFIFILKNAPTKAKKEFISKIFSLHHNIIFWVFAILTPIVLGGIFQLFSILLTDHSFSPANPIYTFFMILIVSILFGGLEEVGWRGYLQEHLMPKISLIPLSIGIGVIWGLWHIPLFFIKEVSHYDFAFIPFLLGAVMFSTFLTWLYAKTRSILLVVIFHASINASATIGFKIEFSNSVLTYLLIILLTTFGIGLLYLNQYKPKAN